MGKHGIAAAAALMGYAALAHAAEATDWTQVYIGVGLGADAVSTEYDTSLAGLLHIGTDDVGTTGFGASLRLGADYQVNTWLVVGAFANIDWSKTGTEIPIGGGALSVSPDLFGVEHAWTVAARAGTLVTPDTLSYFLVGYTEVAFTEVTFVGVPLFKMPDGQGIVVGSGFEHRLTPNVSLTGEYRASYLDEETLFSVPGGVDISSDTVLHTGRVGLAYRFGGASNDKVAPDQFMDGLLRRHRHRCQRR
jgi:opacity protein-like surface antigen